MTHALTIDRLEGVRKRIAVLLDDRGRTINFPLDLLPEGSGPGDVLSVTVERDEKETRRILEESRSIDEELTQRDPGGDLKI